MDMGEGRVISLDGVCGIGEGLEVLDGGDPCPAARKIRNGCVSMRVHMGSPT